MTAAAVQMVSAETEEEFGVVLARSGNKARVSLPTGERWTEVAASCLLSPASGDRVLVVHSGDEGYVLAVLARAREGEARLVFDHDVLLQVNGGRLSLQAREGVEMVSPQALTVRVGRVEAAVAEKCQIAFSALDLVGQSLSCKAKNVRFVAETFDTLASRIYQRAVNFLRRTDELDRVEAKNIDRRAEKLLHLHAENAVTTAEHLVKIDGSQVHVG